MPMYACNVTDIKHLFEFAVINGNVNRIRQLKGDVTTIFASSW
jgi:hypothetical protein